MFSHENSYPRRTGFPFETRVRELRFSIERSRITGIFSAAINSHSSTPARSPSFLSNRSSRENAPHPHRSCLPQETGVRVIRNDLTNVPGQKPPAGPGYVAVLPGRILSAPRRFVDAGVFSNFRSPIDRSRSSPPPRRNLHRRLSQARTRERYIR